MPPKTKVTGEKIVSAGLALAREGGPGAVNARAVAAKLGCSTQPVFSNYDTMEALQRDVLAAAEGLFRDRLAAAMAEGRYPPYKAMGMAYVAFARQEPALYRWLFMRDRSGQDIPDGRAENGDAIRLIAEKTGLSPDAAWRFHLEMWVFVHGLGAMTATGYLDWDEGLIDGMLTDMFEGLRARFAQKEA